MPTKSLHNALKQFSGSYSCPSNQDTAVLIQKVCYKAAIFQLCRHSEDKQRKMPGRESTQVLLG